MRNWGSLKINYFNNKKAQTLTELAAFGSILLLVLAFFISYGMRYNYQQDVQMRAFRSALKDAYTNPNNRPDASASIVLVEDKHIPDPRDMFGAGNIVPAQAGAEVTWGNTLNDMYNVPAAISDPLSTDLPRTEYKINGTTYAYTTAYYTYTATALQDHYFKVPGQADRVKISKTNASGQANIKIYNPDPIEDPVHPGTFLPATQVMVDLTPEIDASTEPLKKQIDTFGEVAISEKGPLMKIIKVLPENGKNGDAITSLCLLNPATGQLDLRYTQLNSDVDMDGIPDVTSGNVQGLLLDAKQEIKRSGALTITETPATTTSTSKYSFTDKSDGTGSPTTITHKIRSSSGVEDIKSPFKRSKTSTWPPINK